VFVDGSRVPGAIDSKKIEQLLSEVGKGG
jgi:hypothetical protein